MFLNEILGQIRHKCLFECYKSSEAKAGFVQQLRYGKRTTIERMMAQRDDKLLSIVS